MCSALIAASYFPNARASSRNRPLGYDLKERQLRVNEAEAKRVRGVYERYLALGCVSKLRAELNAQGMVSKQRLSRRGVASGGVPYSRGALYELLKNRLYLGEITYRGEIYPGPT